MQSQAGDRGRPRLGATSVRGALRHATRWQRVEVDAFAMLAAGLAVALPVAVGMLLDRPAEGLVGALGALMISSSGNVGRLSDRGVELLLSGLVALAGVCVGKELGGRSVASSTAIVLVSIAAMALGSLRPAGAKTRIQFVVTMIVGSTLAAAPLATGLLAACFAAGAAFGGVLTLAAYGAGRLVLRLPRPDPARTPRPWRVDAATWRARMRTWAGWEYPVRMGACMAVAAVFVNVLPGSHSTWVLLTVVIVVQPDRRDALIRTISRGLGTVLGVAVGIVLLQSVPSWVVVAVVGVIAAVRGHLKVANYTAYSVVMTPLVLVLTSLGHGAPAEVLVERVVDTGLGCLISLVVGIGLWRVVADAHQRSRDEPGQ
ncbi:hypothetical protein GCM10011584_07760 [Nocardioides phosphati]|uniref:Integral membrane bound transporter domain-containing protein n=1 Tax=Nocardioides phosphati TaxID=1867775 RepID=A0ABQ2N7J2_9ACTN|nr:FUSC family protein [Nocardioides phosphati]GGO86137.1 hypothetical protein GCM10011584_07760 [Nocardioides phosphati]